ncbi:MtrAB system histidine kinase MtrB [Streptacidiphilus jiangxiensis]|uniref:Sensor histidine kinase MtrB n=1 Tax=Streptacidiphilus jiangxiensis TaxID=235985 RepID=A0A1H7RRD8_STRJI|nr:MtrAB system histidine kinase MtrB [Streptacidiphilus jiangxiensis]SEL62569.1 two-component system, OmpR family, sensor histidine kinase MtrB [Streptacidiphilus jiangxiensis]
MSGQTPAALPDPDGGRSTVQDTRSTKASQQPFLSALGRQLRRPFRRAVGLYRRSIQLRVVAMTLVLSLGVVLLLGVVVMNQVRNGLLQTKMQSAQTQAESGFAAAKTAAGDLGTLTHKTGTATSPQAGGGAASGADTAPDVGAVMIDQVKTLAQSGAGSYSVVGMLPPSSSTTNTSSRAMPTTGGVDPTATIPADLQLRVAANVGSPEGAFTTVTYLNGTQSQSGVVIGEQITLPSSVGTDATGGGASTGGAYQLYYVFPFAQETSTLNLVTGTLATAGVFVVILLGAISWLVVRQVVTPLRMAAEISEQLASGRLEERMKVSGTDDITRLGESFNRMAGALQAQIRQLEELSRVQRRFVSDVSHELRTPLTTVRMAADLLYEAREDFDDPMAVRSAELLQNQLDRFESLLADLLEISRFDAGAAILDSEPTDLREVVGRVIDGAGPLAERKGSAVRVIGADEPVVAECDPRRIERILRNLVVNALEHGEGRDIEVLMAAGDGAVAVAVRDHGIGLKPGEAARVFNRFWRADPARARTTGGTGLGLSIALEDAALHGGWLHAWGEPGGGSQFRLTVPRNAGTEISRSPIPLEPEDSRGNLGLDVSGSPYRRARPAGATALPAMEAEQAAAQPSLGPGLGGVLGYGSVIPALPGPVHGTPGSNPADLGSVSGLGGGFGTGGAQVVVPGTATTRTDERPADPQDVDDDGEGTREEL